MNKSVLLRLMNFWPPLWGAGIKLDYLGPDFKEAKVSLKLKRFNRNYVGTHYGGSLYSMTDPFYMLMLIQILGSDYLVWDKAASIRFKKPGTGKVVAHFLLTDAIITEIKEDILANGKTEKTFLVQIKNEKGEVVTEVDKLLWIAAKKKKSGQS